MSQKKAYCKTCKHIRRSIGLDECRIEKEATSMQNFCVIKNKDGECKDYSYDRFGRVKTLASVENLMIIMIFIFSFLYSLIAIELISGLFR